MPVATEVASPEHVEKALKAGIDYLWIGARSSANPLAVQEIANAIDRFAVRPLHCKTADAVRPAFGLLDNYTPTDDEVVLIEDDGLAGSDTPDRLAEYQRAYL